ncbi:hypothetical protein J6590_026428 [Homalodisca vitripennis]|nr:hypothetical protein J6590_026428 [Homalodisca vitripennis]
MMCRLCVLLLYCEVRAVNPPTRYLQSLPGNDCSVKSLGCIGKVMMCRLCVLLLYCGVRAVNPPTRYLQSLPGNDCSVKSLGCIGKVMMVGDFSAAYAYCCYTAESEPSTLLHATCNHFQEMTAVLSHSAVLCRLCVLLLYCEVRAVNPPTRYLQSLPGNDCSVKSLGCIGKVMMAGDCSAVCPYCCYTAESEPSTLLHATCNHFQEITSSVNSFGCIGSRHEAEIYGVLEEYFGYDAILPHEKINEPANWVRLEVVNTIQTSLSSPAELYVSLTAHTEKECSSSSTVRNLGVVSLSVYTVQTSLSSPAELYVSLTAHTEKERSTSSTVRNLGVVSLSVYTIQTSLSSPAELYVSMTAHTEKECSPSSTVRNLGVVSLSVYTIQTSLSSPAELYVSLTAHTEKECSTSSTVRNQDIPGRIRMLTRSLVNDQCVGDSKNV